MQDERKKAEEGEDRIKGQKQVTISRDNATGPILDIIIEQQQTKDKRERS